MIPESSAPVSARRNAIDLFLVSSLILFLELACIRWFPAHVLFLTFFTNMALLASFLGMALGCLTADRQRDFIRVAPALLAVSFSAAFGIEWLTADEGNRYIDVGNQASPQLIYFGAEYNAHDLAQFRIPVEWINGFFFVMLTLTFIGPGQMLGRALRRIPNRVAAYSIDICGSLMGILLFTAVSALRLAPFWWFLPVSLSMAYFLVSRQPRSNRRLRWGLRLLIPALLPFLANVQVKKVIGISSEDGESAARTTEWSPYYRVDFEGFPYRRIDVNLIGHQQMFSRSSTFAPAYAYALPHALRRDTGKPPFESVLIIGAGSGNDVSRALQWGAEHVDAVEIDPVIARLGKEYHPDHPYDDPRVTLHLDDGRNFLHAADKQYDLIIYALVDSLVLHSSFSNIRLESYLYTRQAFEDVKRRLKPGGTFMTSNYFRQGWVVARLRNTLHEVFGEEPLVMALPYRAELGSGDSLTGSFTVLLAGDTAGVREAFSRRPDYWLRNTAPNPDPAVTPNGFTVRPSPGEEDRSTRFGLARVPPPAETLRPPTDDWPFLYLHSATIPNLTLRGIGIMGGLALLMLYAFYPRGAGDGTKSGARMFFLGAGFMLIETRAVVHMALLFGGTWIVNSVVFFAVLSMILAANAYASVLRPRSLLPYYVGLFVSLAMNAVVPLDSFLGMGRGPQVAASCLLVFAPILFAGVIFAVSFTRVARPDRAFGFNVAGAMVGGLAENASMLLGFQYLMLAAMGFYALSTWGGTSPDNHPRT